MDKKESGRGSVAVVRRAVSRSSSRHTSQTREGGGDVSTARQRAEVSPHVLALPQKRSPGRISPRSNSPAVATGPRLSRRDLNADVEDDRRSDRSSGSRRGEGSSPKTEISVSEKGNAKKKGIADIKKGRVQSLSRKSTSSPQGRGVSPKGQVVRKSNMDTSQDTQAKADGGITKAGKSQSKSGVDNTGKTAQTKKQLAVKSPRHLQKPGRRSMGNLHLGPIGKALVKKRAWSLDRGKAGRNTLKNTSAKGTKEKAPAQGESKSLDLHVGIMNKTQNSTGKGRGKQVKKNANNSDSFITTFKGGKDTQIETKLLQVLKDPLRDNDQSYVDKDGARDSIANQGNPDKLLEPLFGEPDHFRDEESSGIPVLEKYEGAVLIDGKTGRPVKGRKPVRPPSLMPETLPQPKLHAAEGKPEKASSASRKAKPVSDGVQLQVAQHLKNLSSALKKETEASAHSIHAESAPQNVQNLTLHCTGASNAQQKRKPGRKPKLQSQGSSSSLETQKSMKDDAVASSRIVSKSADRLLGGEHAAPAFKKKPGPRSKTMNLIASDAMTSSQTKKLGISSLDSTISFAQHVEKTKVNAGQEDVNVAASAQTSTDAPMKRKAGRPPGAKAKPKSVGMRKRNTVTRLMKHKSSTVAQQHGTKPVVTKPSLKLETTAATDPAEAEGIPVTVTNLDDSQGWSSCEESDAEMNGNKMSPVVLLKQSPAANDKLREEVTTVKAARSLSAEFVEGSMSDAEHPTNDAGVEEGEGQNLVGGFLAKGPVGRGGKPQTAVRGRRQFRGVGRSKAIQGVMEDTRDSAAVMKTSELDSETAAGNEGSNVMPGAGSLFNPSIMSLLKDTIKMREELAKEKLRRKSQDMVEAETSVVEMQTKQDTAGSGEERSNLFEQFASYPDKLSTSVSEQIPTEKPVEQSTKLHRAMVKRPRGFAVKKHRGRGRLPTVTRALKGQRSPNSKGFQRKKGSVGRPPKHCPEQKNHTNQEAGRGAGLSDDVTEQVRVRKKPGRKPKKRTLEGMAPAKIPVGSVQAAERDLLRHRGRRSSVKSLKSGPDDNVCQTEEHDAKERPVGTNRRGRRPSKKPKEDASSGVTVESTTEPVQRRKLSTERKTTPDEKADDDPNNDRKLQSRVKTELSADHKAGVPGQASSALRKPASEEKDCNEGQSQWKPKKPPTKPVRMKRHSRGNELNKLMAALEEAKLPSEKHKTLDSILGFNVRTSRNLSIKSKMRTRNAALGSSGDTKRQDLKGVKQKPISKRGRPAKGPRGRPPRHLVLKSIGDKTVESNKEDVGVFRKRGFGKGRRGFKRIVTSSTLTAIMSKSLELVENSKLDTMEFKTDCAKVEDSSRAYFTQGKSSCTEFAEVEAKVTMDDGSDNQTFKRGFTGSLAGTNEEVVEGVDESLFLGQETEEDTESIQDPDLIPPEEFEMDENDIKEEVVKHINQNEAESVASLKSKEVGTGLQKKSVVDGISEETIASPLGGTDLGDKKTTETVTDGSNMDFVSIKNDEDLIESVAQKEFAVSKVNEDVKEGIAKNLETPSVPQDVQILTKIDAMTASQQDIAVKDSIGDLSLLSEDGSQNTNFKRQDSFVASEQDSFNLVLDISNTQEMEDSSLIAGNDQEDAATKIATYSEDAKSPLSNIGELGHLESNNMQVSRGNEALYVKGEVEIVTLSAATLQMDTSMNNNQQEGIDREGKVQTGKDGDIFRHQPSSSSKMDSPISADASPDEKRVEKLHTLESSNETNIKPTGLEAKDEVGVETTGLLELRKMSSGQNEEAKQETGSEADPVMVVNTVLEDLVSRVLSDLDQGTPEKVEEGDALSIGVVSRVPDRGQQGGIDVTSRDLTAMGLTANNLQHKEAEDGVEPQPTMISSLVLVPEPPREEVHTTAEEDKPTEQQSETDAAVSRTMPDSGEALDGDAHVGDTEEDLAGGEGRVADIGSAAAIVDPSGKVTGDLHPSSPSSSEDVASNLDVGVVVCVPSSIGSVLAASGAHNNNTVEASESSLIINTSSTTCGVSSRSTASGVVLLDVAMLQNAAGDNDQVIVPTLHDSGNVTVGSVSSALIACDRVKATCSEVEPEAGQPHGEPECENVDKSGTDLLTPLPVDNAFPKVNTVASEGSTENKDSDLGKYSETVIEETYNLEETSEEKFTKETPTSVLTLKSENETEIVDSNSKTTSDPRLSSNLEQSMENEVSRNEELNVVHDQISVSSSANQEISASGSTESKSTCDIAKDASNAVHIGPQGIFSGDNSTEITADGKVSLLNTDVELKHSTKGESGGVTEIKDSENTRDQMHSDERRGDAIKLEKNMESLRNVENGEDSRAGSKGIKTPLQRGRSKKQQRRERAKNIVGLRWKKLRASSTPEKDDVAGASHPQDGTRASATTTEEAHRKRKAFTKRRELDLLFDVDGPPSKMRREESRKRPLGEKKTILGERISLESSKREKRPVKKLDEELFYAQNAHVATAPPPRRRHSTETQVHTEESTCDGGMLEEDRGVNWQEGADVKGGMDTQHEGGSWLRAAEEHRGYCSDGEGRMKSLNKDTGETEEEHTLDESSQQEVIDSETGKMTTRGKKNRYWYLFAKQDRKGNVTNLLSKPENVDINEYKLYRQEMFAHYNKLEKPKKEKGEKRFRHSTGSQSYMPLSAEIVPTPETPTTPGEEPKVPKLVLKLTNGGRTQKAQEGDVFPIADHVVTGDEALEAVQPLQIMATEVDGVEQFTLRDLEEDFEDEGEMLMDEDSEGEVLTRTEFLISQCKPCSVLLVDFIKCLNLSNKTDTSGTDEDGDIFNEEQIEGISSPVKSMSNAAFTQSPYSNDDASPSKKMKLSSSPYESEFKSFVDSKHELERFTREKVYEKRQPRASLQIQTKTEVIDPTDRMETSPQTEGSRFSTLQGSITLPGSSPVNSSTTSASVSVGSFQKPHVDKTTTNSTPLTAVPIILSPVYSDKYRPILPKGFEGTMFLLPPTVATVSSSAVVTPTSPVVGKDSTKTSVSYSSSVNDQSTTLAFTESSAGNIPALVSVGKQREVRKTARKQVKKSPTSVHLPMGIQVRFRCLCCTYTCNSRAVMGEHIYNHTDIVPYSCGYCGSIFGTRSGVMVHTKRDHTGQAYKILKNSPLTEGDYFTTSENFLRMQAEGTLPKLKPPGKFGVLEHNSNTASPTEAAGTQLTGASAASSTGAKRSVEATVTSAAMSSSNNNLKCRYCKFTSGVTAVMEEHVSQLHQKERRYICPVCRVSFFKQLDSMKKHMQKWHVGTEMTIAFEPGFHRIDSPLSTNDNEVVTPSFQQELVKVLPKPLNMPVSDSSALSKTGSVLRKPTARKSTTPKKSRHFSSEDAQLKKKMKEFLKVRKESEACIPVPGKQKVARNAASKMKENGSSAAKQATGKPQVILNVPSVAKEKQVQESVASERSAVGSETGGSEEDTVEGGTELSLLITEVKSLRDSSDAMDTTLAQYQQESSVSVNQKSGVSEPVKEMADSQTPEKDSHVRRVAGSETSLRRDTSPEYMCKEVSSTSELEVERDGQAKPTIIDPSLVDQRLRHIDSTPHSVIAGSVEDLSPRKKKLSKVYVCKRCNRQFFDDFDTATMHLSRAHQINYAFACPYCPFSCSGQKHATLVHHLEQFHGEKQPKNLDISILNQDDYFIVLEKELPDRPVHKKSSSGKTAAFHSAASALASLASSVALPHHQGSVATVARVETPSGGPAATMSLTVPTRKGYVQIEKEEERVIFVSSAGQAMSRGDMQDSRTGAVRSPASSAGGKMSRREPPSYKQAIVSRISAPVAMTTSGAQNSSKQVIVQQDDPTVITVAGSHLTQPLDFSHRDTPPSADPSAAVQASSGALDLSHRPPAMPGLSLSHSWAPTPGIYATATTNRPPPPLIPMGQLDHRPHSVAAVGVGLARRNNQAPPLSRAPLSVASAAVITPSLLNVPISPGGQVADSSSDEEDDMAKEAFSVFNLPRPGVKKNAVRGIGGAASAATPPSHMFHTATRNRGPSPGPFPSGTPSPRDMAQYRQFQARPTKNAGIPAGLTNFHHPGNSGLTRFDVQHQQPRLSSMGQFVAGFRDHPARFRPPPNVTVGPGMDEMPQRFSRTLNCPYCTYKCDKTEVLHKHILTHGPNVKWTCPYCPMTNQMTKSVVEKHISKCHPGMQVMYIPFGVDLQPGTK